MNQSNHEILVVITSGISIIMGFYMLLLYRSTPGEKATAYWAFGSLTVGGGILFKLVPPFDSFIAVVVPTLFITLGLYYYLAGIWQFKRKKIRPWIVLGIPALNVIQSILLSQFLPNDKIRFILYQLFLIIYCSIAIYEMIKLPATQKYLQKIFRTNALFFAIYLSMLLAGLWMTFSQNAFIPSNNSTSALVLFILSSLLMVALTFGFISAVNLKLYHELEEELKTKNKFFSIIAHDLRGPVGTIMNFLKVLNNDTEIEKQEREYYLMELEKLSQSTFHLLQNLFDWSNTKNLSNVQEELIELNKLISENVTLFERIARFKSIKMVFEKDYQPVIKGDPKMVEVILRNLVSNALKFTPNGGKVTIKTKNTKDKVQLKVVDTGLGISPEKLKTLYSSEKSNSSLGTNGEVGSGFGMIVCNEFIQKLNGTMQIKSELNRGTAVIVEFPNVENKNSGIFALN